jgi:hypothetical protein
MGQSGVHLCGFRELAETRPAQAPVSVGVSKASAWGQARCLGQTMRPATSEKRKAGQRGASMEGTWGREEGWRGGAVVQPAILPNQSLEPCTCPHLSWTDRYRVQDKCRPRHRGSFRRGLKRSREEHGGSRQAEEAWAGGESGCWCLS